MSFISKVEVLCPNGHRVTVNVKPNTKLFQVAEECCLKQHLGAAAGFGLKMRHNQKPVDMSLSVQLAGLTNNAKLDLYQRTNQKTETKARIALQVDGIGRLQQEFDSSKTLLEVLESFQSSGGHLDLFQLMSDGQQPVINYMKEEIIGMYALRSTTLRTLGILDGGHLLRLSFRTISPEALEDIHARIDKENARLARLAARATTAETSPQMSSTGYQPSFQTAPAEPVPCTSKIDRPESDCKASVSEDRMDTLVADDFLANQGNAGNLGIQDIQAWPMDTQYELPVANDNPAYQQFPFMEFKFPEETKGKDLYHNELSEVRRKDFKPCERESVLYNLNDVEGVEYEAEEDSFFEHTVDDIKILKDCLEQEVTSYNDQLLCTQSMRLERQSSLLANYSRFILRFQFPGGFVLQGVFRPLETVFALYKYVKENLEDKNLEFELFMSPPKVILDDKTKTLTEAGLSPMTVIYCKSGDRNDGFLAREMLNCMSSPAEAKQVREKYMPSDNSRSRPTRQQSPSACQPSTSSLSAQIPSSSSQNRAQTTTNVSNKIPKWFKPGK